MNAYVRLTLGFLAGVFVGSLIGYFTESLWAVLFGGAIFPALALLKPWEPGEDSLDSRERTIIGGVLEGPAGALGIQWARDEMEPTRKSSRGNTGRKIEEERKRQNQVEEDAKFRVQRHEKKRAD